MKQKHSPSPWEVVDAGINGKYIYAYDRDYSGHGKRRMIADITIDYAGAEANARLIALAPVLLDTLISLVEILEKDLDPEHAREAREIISKLMEI